MAQRIVRSVFTGVVLISLLLCLPTCAVNPVSGKQEFMLLNEQEEAQLGGQTDAEITKEYGLYEDPPLTAYVSQMGQGLAKSSHRPGLNYQFKILESSVVNAFAVPGGYVYLTRGILASLNSEAELAGVLGHEIGHITARHSAQQYSRAQVAQVGLALGAIAGQFFPAVSQVAGVAQVGVQMLFLSFSRDNERQADSLAVEYSTKAAYDGAQLSAFFESLERMNPGSDRTGLPSWFSTHPSPADRLQAVRAQAKEWQARTGGSSWKVNRNEYLRRIEGLPYGEDPGQGYVADGTFYHPELRFQFPVPAGWKLNNTPSNVQMASAKQDAAILFLLTSAPSPAEAANAFASKTKARVVKSEATRVNALPAQRQVSELSTQEGPLRVMSYFIQKDKQVYAFHGISSGKAFPNYERLFTQTMGEFKELSDPKRINVRPDRIALRSTQSSGTLESALRSLGVRDQELKEVALLNGKDLSESLPANTLLKVVERGR